MKCCFKNYAKILTCAIFFSTAYLSHAQHNSAFSEIVKDKMAEESKKLGLDKIQKYAPGNPELLGAPRDLVPLKNGSPQACAQAFSKAFQKLTQVASNLSDHLKQSARQHYGRLSSDNSKTAILDLAEEVKTLSGFQPPYTFGQKSYQPTGKEEALSRILHYKDFTTPEMAIKLCDRQARKTSKRASSYFFWKPENTKKHILDELKELRFPEFLEKAPPAHLKPYFENEIKTLIKVFEAV